MNPLLDYNTYTHQNDPYPIMVKHIYPGPSWGLTTSEPQTSKVTALLEVDEVAKSDSLFILPAEIEEVLDSVKKKEEVVMTFKIWSQLSLI